MLNKTVGHHDAFPTEIRMTEGPVSGPDGLTKREFFAALAMVGMLSNMKMAPNDIARASVSVADHLIEALNAQ